MKIGQKSCASSGNASYEILSFYCAGAALQKFRKNVRNPLRMGYAKRTKYIVLRLHAGRELRRAKFADDGNTGARANSIGSGIDHGIGIGCRANAAGRLY